MRLWLIALDNLLLLSYPLNNLKTFLDLPPERILHVVQRARIYGIIFTNPRAGDSWLRLERTPSVEPSLFADPMRALGFDATDLQVNRTGRITPRQKRRVLSLFGLKFMGVIVGFIAAVSAGVFLIPRLGTIQSWTAGERVALVFGVLFGLGSIHSVWGVAYDVIGGKCVSVTGNVTIQYQLDQQLGMIANLTVKDASSDRQYEFEIITAYVPIPQGGITRVYFTPATHTVMALEVLQ
jgi:hypothetical protein